MAQLDLEAPVTATPIDGYRPNICAVVVNERGEVLLGQRRNEPGKPPWEYPLQFPQGGIEAGETPRAACFRELIEETGLAASQVNLLGHAPNWLAYEIPRSNAVYRHGQVQAWCLLELTVPASSIDLAALLESSSDNEFEQLRWADPAEALRSVVSFKQDVYRAALTALAEQHMRGNEMWDKLRSAAPD